MSQAECDRLLSELGWGVIAVAETRLDDARPTGVPVSYALRDSQIVLTMSQGRKLTALARNPSLALTVTDVHSLNSWRSLMLCGRAHWLTARSDRAEAIRAFLEASRRSSSRRGCPTSDRQCSSKQRPAGDRLRYAECRRGR